ncbi:hypothetical protein Bca4012_039443 [Brassica carinata]
MSSSTEATARLAMEAQISLSAFRAPPLGICSSHVSYSDGDFPAEWSSGAWDSLWLGVSSKMSHVAYAQEVSTVGVWLLARSSFSSTELETVLRRVLPLVLRGGTWASLNGAPLGHLECLSLGSSCVECNIPALDGVFVQVMTISLGSCHEASSDFAGFVLRIGVVDLCWVRVESFGSKRRRGIRVRTLKHRRKSRVRA